ncbi:MAG TPA: hypothetical protein DDZ39_11515 [Flavobacteriaceae bacterium]|jgi:hypothetical protein|nr:hypothetical protein [Flavobacteriaceae bacterium]HBS11548.1 hypothetical protein [Flavobacteriaceae bacterium]
MFKAILYITFISLFVGQPSVSELRELYVKASDSKEIAELFSEKLKDIKKTDKAVLVAYKAAALTIQAKHAKKIKDKKTYFKQGAALLEYIITENPNDIELRVIRLSIQENSPKVLKYRKNKSEDTAYIFKHLKVVSNKEKKIYIKAFVLQSKSFSTEEKNVISEL